MGEQIRQLRRRAFLTQRELASRLNLTTQAIHMWERGYRKPSLSSWGRLAVALPEFKVEIEALAAGVG